MNTLRQIILIGAFSLIQAPMSNAEKILDFNAHQKDELQKVLRLNFDKLTMKEYTQFRATMTSLATNNPARTLDLTYDMLTNVEFYKKQPEVHFLFKKNVELNLVIMFTLLASSNEIPIGHFPMSDLLARFEGVGSYLEDPAQAEAAAKVYTTLLDLQQNIK